MSKNIAYIASKMKEAERIKENILDTMFSKNKLESWDFTQEDIQTGWEQIDLLLMIDCEVSVQAALNRAVERMELAEQTMNRRDEMERIGLPYDDMTAMRSLEDF